MRDEDRGVWATGKIVALLTGTGSPDVISSLDILILGCGECIQVEMPDGSWQSGPSSIREKSGLEIHRCQSFPRKDNRNTEGRGVVKRRERVSGK